MGIRNCMMFTSLLQNLQLWVGEAGIEGRLKLSSWLRNILEWSFLLSRIGFWNASCCRKQQIGNWENKAIDARFKFTVWWTAEARQMSNYLRQYWSAWNQNERNCGLFLTHLIGREDRQMIFVYFSVHYFDGKNWSCCG